MNATIKEELTSTRVQKTSNGKYNIIDKQGKSLSEEFKWIGYFDPGTGFARVQREDGKFNYITEDGKLLSKQWFDWAEDFEDGLALVQRERENPRFNYIDKEGKIISDEWFRWVDYFDNDGFAEVYRTNGEQCKIDKQGKIVVRK